MTFLKILKKNTGITAKVMLCIGAIIGVIAVAVEKLGNTAMYIYEQYGLIPHISFLVGVLFVAIIVCSTVVEYTLGRGK